EQTAPRPEPPAPTTTTATPPAGRGPPRQVEYRSAAGIEYRARADTGPINNAIRALAKDSTNVALISILGLAQLSRLQFQEAIETFTRGLRVAPGRAGFLAGRADGYLRVREFDKAAADYGTSSDTTIPINSLQQGLARFAQGNFGPAADAFAR